MVTTIPQLEKRLLSVHREKIHLLKYSGTMKSLSSFICDKNHEWQASSSSVINQGTGCPYCSGNKVWIGFNDLATTHPHLALEWSEKNSKLPTDITVGHNSNIWWQCDLKHEWQAKPAKRKLGHGCHYCTHQKVLAGFNDLQTIFPDIAKEWHPTKNGNLLPTDVLSKTNKRVWWMCKAQHEWKVSINSRDGNHACPYCSGRLAISGENDLSTTNYSLAKEWHPTKNGELLPTDVMAQTNKRVWWMCKAQHEWEAPVAKRSTGTGCPYCSGRKTFKGFNDLMTLLPKLAREWHPTKNNLRSDEVTIKSGKKVWWMCKAQHEWKAQIASRSNGKGCPSCTKYQKAELNLFKLIREAFPKEIVIHNGLERKIKIPREDKGQNKTFTPDIIFPDKKLIIEHDGTYWHDRQEDIYKNAAAEKAGWTVIRVVQGTKKHKTEWESISNKDIYYTGQEIPKTVFKELIQKIMISFRI